MSYIDSSRFVLDTLWAANRPHPDLEFLGGVRGHHFRPIWGVPGIRAGLSHTYVLARGRGHYVKDFVAASRWDILYVVRLLNVWPVLAA